jgi:predicted Zn-dependent protease
VRAAAPPDGAVAAHLAAADSARRAGNRLRQLAEADAALRLDPRSARARYLLGDALVATGDTATGCRYLRAARRLPEARSALAAGGCPPD